MDLTKASRSAAILWLLAVGVSVTASRRIDSAIRFDERRLLFFSGEDCARVDDYGYVTSLRKTLEHTRTGGFNVEAALQLPKLDYYIYYSATSGLWKDNSDVDFPDFKPFKYGPNRKFLQGGPDAAARKGRTVYVFKGCKVAVRKAWNVWEKPVNVRDLNLPCHVDAAWNEGEDMGILRGDQVWYWRADGTVDGPRAFNLIFNIPSWTVDPYTGPEE